jgi:hypothetical protein
MAIPKLVYGYEDWILTDGCDGWILTERMDGWILTERHKKNGRFEAMDMLFLTAKLGYWAETL